jgi:opacity protein-like surface antigen
MSRIGRAIQCAVLVGLMSGMAAWAAGPRHYPRQGAPADAPTGAFRLSVGIFSPDGDSVFWSDNADLFTGDVGDFDDTTFRGQLEWGLGPRASVVFGLGSYNGSSRRAYRDFVDGDGFDIVHDATLEITPLTVGVMLAPGGRDKRVVPYLTVGVGFYNWEYTEVGDFIDFGSGEDPPPIIFGAFVADGVATGFYAGLGIDFAIAPSTSLFVEGRWQQVDDEPGDDFEGFGDLDLSGSELSVGLAWKF